MEVHLSAIIRNGEERGCWHNGAMDKAPDMHREGDLHRHNPTLLTAMRSLQSALDTCDRQVAERLGLCLNDARALRFVRDNGPVPARHLMVELDLTSGSVTALLDRMEDRGLVERSADAKDRRVVRVQATPMGRSAIETAYAPLSEVADKLTNRLGSNKASAVTKQINDLVRLTEWASHSME